MSLTNEQLVITAEIAREAYDDVETAATKLNAAQESWLSDDLDAWQGLRLSYDVKMKGGKFGVDFDEDRQRAAIFFRVRNMLDFPEVAYSMGSDVLQFLELEVGSQFV